MAYSEITFTRKKLPSTQIVDFVLIRIMTHHCRVRDLVAAFEKPSIEAPHRKLPLWQGRGSQDPRQRFMDLSIMSRMQPREDPMEYVQKCVEATTTQDEFLKTSRPYGGVPPHVMEKPTWQCCGLCGSKVFRNTAKWMPGMVADEQECDRRHTENCKCHKGTQPMRRSTFPYQCISCERYVCMRCFDNRLGPKDEWSDAEMDQMMCKLCTHKVRDASSFPMKMPLTWKWGSVFFQGVSKHTSTRIAKTMPSGTKMAELCEGMQSLQNRARSMDALQFSACLWRSKKCGGSWHVVVNQCIFGFISRGSPKSAICARRGC